MITARLVLAAAGAMGVDVAALQRDLGLADDLLANADARIPVELDARLWQEAAARSGDPAFGIHVAESLPISRVHVLDYLVAASASQGDALRRFVRYAAMLNDNLQLDVAVEGERVRLRLRSRSADALSRHAQECFLAIMMIRARVLLGADTDAAEVCLPFAAPEDLREYRRIFGCRARFDHPRCEAFLPAAHLELPVQTADPTLCAILDEHAEERLARLPRHDAFVSRVRSAVASALPGGDPSLSAVSKSLRMHPRTLQRRLVEEGTTYNELLDGERRQRALQHLTDRRMSVSEIGFLLGFSRPSAFVRAFRRWTGMTPMEHRARGGA